MATLAETLLQALTSTIPSSRNCTKYAGPEGDYIAIKRSEPSVDVSISLAELPAEACSVQVTLDSDPLMIAFDDVISNPELMILRDLFLSSRMPPLNRFERVEFVLDWYWNPIGLARNREPSNEYARYANKIVRMQDEGVDSDRTIGYLKGVRVNSLGLTSSDDQLDDVFFALTFVASSGFNDYWRGSTNNPMDRSVGSAAS